MSDPNDLRPELERYRERCRLVEARVVELQLEVSRQEQIVDALNRLLLASRQSSIESTRESEVRIGELQAEIRALQARCDMAVAEIQQVRRSLSWRYTAPARWLLERIRGY